MEQGARFGLDQAHAAEPARWEIDSFTPDGVIYPIFPKDGAARIPKNARRAYIFRAFFELTTVVDYGNFTVAVPTTSRRLKSRNRHGAHSKGCVPHRRFLAQSGENYIKLLMDPI